MEEREKRLRERDRKKRMTEEKAAAKQKSRKKERREEELVEEDDVKNVMRMKYDKGKERSRERRRN